MSIPVPDLSWTSFFVAVGTIGMSSVIVYIEILKPLLQKPKLKIEFDNGVPFCRDVREEKRDKQQYHIRLRVENKGGSVARGLRGKLVKVANEDGTLDTDFDPLFLHWTTVEPKPTEISSIFNWENILEPIDLNKREFEFLDIFYLISGEEKSEKPVNIYHTNFPRGCLKGFGTDKLTSAFKITIYGENVKPVTKTYKLDWNGKKYNEIRMYEMEDEKKMQKKRTVITTIFGGVFGIVCMLLLRYVSGVSFWPTGIYSLLHHCVMGFTIGVSSLKVHWAPHGILWGFLFGVFLGISYWGQPQGFWVPWGLVILWGFLIELITSAGFKLTASAAQKKASK